VQRHRISDRAVAIEQVEVEIPFRNPEFHSVLSASPLSKSDARGSPNDSGTGYQWTVAADADKISGMFLEERAVVAMSAADAERLAADLYGVVAVATILPGEYDCNFHLRACDGREIVLKCMHPARERSFIEMQCAALEHLSTHAPHLPLPRVQRNIQGQQFAEITDRADRNAWCGC
jgi:hypothetical protein